MSVSKTCGTGDSGWLWREEQQDNAILVLNPGNGCTIGQSSAYLIDASGLEVCLTVG